MSENKKVQWPEKQLNDFILLCLSFLNIEVKKKIEIRARAGTGSEHLINDCSCESNSFATGKSHCSSHNTSIEYPHNHSILYKFQKNNDDYIGIQLDELTVNTAIQNVAVEVSEKAASVWRNISKQSSTKLSKFEEYNIHKEILTEALIRSILMSLNKHRLETHSLNAKDGSLLAIPSSSLKKKLENLHNNTILSLIQFDIAIQSDYIGHNIASSIYNELEFMEFDGRFRSLPSVDPSQISYRTDHICWISSSDLDRDTNKNTLLLMNRMCLIPFELNFKASLNCQITHLFQFSFFPSTGSYYKLHSDSSFDEHLDTGRKITAIYIPGDFTWKKEYGGEIMLEVEDYLQDRVNFFSKKENIHLVGRKMNIYPQGAGKLIMKYVPLTENYF